MVISLFMKQTIKKYPNRRLYDTSRSQYVNMDYIKTLVNERTDFNVVDSKSGDDVTKTILLQIISESETNEHQSLLTNKLLKQLIRFYGDPFQHNFAKYLENSVKLIAEQRSKVRSQLEQAADPFTMMASLANRNMEVFKEMQEGLFKKVMSSSTVNKKK